MVGVLMWRWLPHVLVGVSVIVLVMYTYSSGFNAGRREVTEDMNQALAAQQQRIATLIRNEGVMALELEKQKNERRANVFEIPAPSVSCNVLPVECLQWIDNTMRAAYPDF